VLIRFEVPADPAYAARVTSVLSFLYVRRYLYVGATLGIVGGLGLIILLLGGHQHSPFFAASIVLLVAGVLAIVVLQWTQYAARRRARGSEVDGAYEITDRHIVMRSGTEHHTLPWADVTGVAEVNDLWVLFMGRTPATVIPRTYLSEAEVGELRRFMSDQFGS
jgi:hypothetical protein